jgi:DNA-binding IclR family transcriptional regulator
LLQAAKPVLRTFARLSAETITLDIPHGAAMPTIARKNARQPIRVATRIVSAVSGGCAVRLA